jgi:hypothetical protein
MKIKSVLIALSLFSFASLGAEPRFENMICRTGPSMRIESNMAYDYSGGGWTGVDVHMRITKTRGSGGFGTSLQRGECGWVTRSFNEAEQAIIKFVRVAPSIRVIRENGQPQQWTLSTPVDDWQTKDKLVVFKATWAGRGFIEAPATQEFKFSDPVRP